MATEGDTNTTENKVNNNNENTAYNNTENKVETQSRRRRTSLYTRARKSFFRSGGTRGADADTIRGTSGADFEGNGTIVRTAVDEIGCLCLGQSDTKDKKKERLLLIKGPFCFVYNVNDESSPKYAVGLQNLKPVIKNENLVVLETTLGSEDSHYEVHFKDKETATKFAQVVKEQASSAQAELVRKRLGHENLLQKKKSVIFAEQIALEKYVKEQPAEPITTKEIMANIPTGADAM